MGARPDEDSVSSLSALRTSDKWEDSEWGLYSDRPVPGKPVLQHGGRKKAVTPSKQETNAEAVQAFLQEGQEDDPAPVDDVEAQYTAYMPSRSLENAINDAAILATKFRDVPYDSGATELPSNSWALYIKAAEKENKTECPIISLRIRPVSETGSVLEREMYSTSEGKWLLLQLLGESSKDQSSLPTFASLTSVTKELRRLAEAASTIPSLRKDVGTEGITSFVWLGEEFLNRHGLPVVSRLKEKIRASNFALLQRYKVEPGMHVDGKTITITDMPVQVAYMYLTTLETSAGRKYVLGFHPETQVWFLMHHHHNWARVSYSLPTLVASVAKGV